MHKKLRKALVYVILLVLVLVVAVWFSIDGILRSQIQSRATEALGTQTTLGSAKLSIFGGSLALRDLTVNNLKGYPDAHLLTMRSCNVQVSLHSLLTNTVVIKLINITGLHISMDQNGLSNNLIAEINHLNNQQSSAATSTPTKGSGGKALAITQVVLRNTVVRMDTSLLPGQKGVPIVITIPRMVLNQPTNPHGRPLRLAGLMEQILVQVAKSLANNPIIPSPVRATLGTATAIIGSGAGTLIHGAGAAVTGAVNSLGHLFSPGNKTSSGGAK